MGQGHVCIFSFVLKATGETRVYSMSDDGRDPDPMSLIKIIMDAQQQNEKQINDTVIPFLKRKKVPTSDHVREAINSAGSENRRFLLRHHAYWKEWRLRIGFESLINSAHQAYMDICRHDAALASFAMRRDFQDYVDRTVGYAAQKDVVAYCSLAVAVRDTLLRIRKRRTDIKDKIQIIVGECFNDDVAVFVKDLRNNIAHGSVVVPQWSVSTDFRNVSGSMKYEAFELISFGKWKSRSKRYVSKSNDDTINISNVIREHLGLLKGMAQEIQDLFARNVTDAERDFFEIEDSYRRIGKRQWAKITVGQIAKEKNPYDYLHRYFDPEPLREILRRPSNSKKQVDYIMALKDTEIDWDDELRRMMYRMFGVERIPDA